ncbi:ATP-binding protein [Ktedonobacter racemifer]|nr:ATP-binding protein [Ktedonobacter racemifer]
MRTLYLVCGAPFSGKTTLAKQIAERTQSVSVSLDDLMRQRGLDLSRPQPAEEWEKAHQQCIQLLDTLMHQEKNVVLDDTLFLKWLRDRYRKVALSHQYQVVTIYLSIPLAELEKRRQQVVATQERNSLANESFYPVIEQFEIPDSHENTIVFDMTTDLSDWMTSHFS